VDKPEISVVTETTVLTNTTDNPDSVAEVIIITIDKGKELRLFCQVNFSEAGFL